MRLRLMRVNREALIRIQRITHAMIIGRITVNLSARRIYRPPLDRSVYDRNNADYSADRPDYSQITRTTTTCLVVMQDSVQSGYSGDYQHAGYSSDGYSRNGYSGDGMQAKTMRMQAIMTRTMRGPIQLAERAMITANASTVQTTDWPADAGR